MASITVQMRQNAAAPVTLFLDVFAVGSNGLPTGASLAQSTLGTSLPTAFEPMTFDFAAGPDLVVGGRYAFQTSSAPGEGGYLLATRTGNNYTGGRGLIAIGASNSLNFMATNIAFGERDVVFRATVPEPALAGLAVLGGLCCLRRR